MEGLEFYKCNFCKKDIRTYKLGDMYRLYLSTGFKDTAIYDDKLICTKYLEKLSKLKGE